LIDVLIAASCLACGAAMTAWGKSTVIARAIIVFCMLLTTSS
jgi:hypothetical protein